MKRRSEPPTEPYPYRDFQVALKRLKAAMTHNHGYALLLGESGTGKTALLRALAAAIDRRLFQPVYLSQGHLSPRGLLSVLLDLFHLSPYLTNAEANRQVLQRLRESPTRLVFLMDEAHLMRDESLQEVRLLAEADLEGPPLFSVVFTAMPDFKERLGAPKLFALWRRLSPRLTLTGLVRDEVAPFLAHVLGKNSVARFSPEALGTIFEQARGLPAQLQAFAAEAMRARPQGMITPDMLTGGFEGMDSE
jgi:type II secretory pathway predicted ATPase ExeA